MTAAATRRDRCPPRGPLVHITRRIGSLRVLGKNMYFRPPGC